MPDLQSHNMKSFIQKMVAFDWNILFEAKAPLPEHQTLINYKV